MKYNKIQLESTRLLILESPGTFGKIYNSMDFLIPPLDIIFRYLFPSLLQ